MVDTGIVMICQLIQTSVASPSQWTGWTDTRQEIYVRYRWGVLSVSIGGRQILEQTLGDRLDSFLSEAEMLPHLQSALALVASEETNCA